MTCHTQMSDIPKPTTSMLTHVKTCRMKVMNAHANMDIHSSNTNTPIHNDAHAHTCMHARTDTHARTRTQTSIHTCAHAHTHTYRQAHMHSILIHVARSLYNIKSNMFSPFY